LETSPHILLKENEQFKKQNRYLRSSLNRICGDVSNGEHIDKEWIEQTLISEPHDATIEALSNKVNALLKENQKLKECVEFYADITKWSGLTILDQDHNKTFEDSNNIYIGGKRARQCLKELGGGYDTDNGWVI
jgi:hypothetical protein